MVFTHMFIEHTTWYLFSTLRAYHFLPSLTNQPEQKPPTKTNMMINDNDPIMFHSPLGLNSDKPQYPRHKPNLFQNIKDSLSLVSYLYKWGNHELWLPLQAISNSFYHLSWWTMIVVTIRIRAFLVEPPTSEQVVTITGLRFFFHASSHSFGSFLGFCCLLNSSQ